MGGPSHELWLNEHPPSADLIGTYPALNQSNSDPRVRYMSNVGPLPGDLPQPIPVRCRFLLYLGALLLTVGYPKVRIEYPRDQIHHGSQPTAGVTQMTPGPPRNGYNALMAPVCAPLFFRYI